MRLSVITEINELQRKMMGYVGLLSYRYCQVCVKAEPCALLPVEQTVAGMEYKMEDLARVYPHQEEDEQHIMDLFPIRPEYLQLIVEGVFNVHPEFKISIEKYKEYDNEEDNNHEANKYVRLTMPDVDKNRRDVIMNFIDVEFNTCKANMSRVEAQCIAKITTLTVADDPAALQEAKDKVKEVVDEAAKMRDDLTNDKKKEVEDAYQRYLTGGLSSAKTPADEANDSSVGQSLKLD